MLILGLLGMYIDAAVVFFTNSSLLFRMAMAVLCTAVAPCTADSPLFCPNEVQTDSFLKKRYCI